MTSFDRQQAISELEGAARALRHDTTDADAYASLCAASALHRLTEDEQVLEVYRRLGEHVYTPA